MLSILKGKNPIFIGKPIRLFDTEDMAAFFHHIFIFSALKLLRELGIQRISSEIVSFSPP